MGEVPGGAGARGDPECGDESSRRKGARPEPCHYRLRCQPGRRSDDLRVRDRRRLRRLRCGVEPNLWGFAYGIFLTPRGLLRGVVRSRRSGSLYRCAIDDDTLDRTVGALRTAVRLHPEEVKPTRGEWVAFLPWMSIGWLWSILCLAVIAAPVVGTLIWLP